MLVDHGADPSAMLAPSWHAAHRPDKPTIVMGSGGVTVSYGQLDERSRRFAHALRSRGLAHGDHIAILMPNASAFLEVAWAAQRAGMYYTAINSHLRANEIQYVLDDCGASALVSDQTMAKVVSGLDLSRIRLRVSADGDLAGFERYEGVLAVQSSAVLDDECEGREMLYSSGTTGRPKGVRKPLPHSRFGDPAAVPAQIALGLTAGGGQTACTFARRRCITPPRWSARCRGNGSARRWFSWKGSIPANASS